MARGTITKMCAGKVLNVIEGYEVVSLLYFLPFVRLLSPDIA